MQQGSWPALPDARRGFDGEVVELALLLLGGEATVLEAAAHARGITVGQLLRCLIREWLAGRQPTVS